MFLDPDTKWECLDYQLLMLRAYAPEDVFTEEAQEGFLEQVDDNDSLINIADALFGYDSDVVAQLPSNLEMLEDQLIESMKNAYAHGIRPVDSDIENWESD